VSGRIPAAIRTDFYRARRLAWWTIGWMASIILVTGLVMGSSQAMRTAWIEDMLSLIPAAVLLIATRYERRKPNRLFGYGYDRVHSLAFAVAASALLFFGAFLLFESVMTLARREHVTIPPVELFGDEIWMGWLMVAALIYSVVPPFILGRMKLPIARRLHDEVLHTDAMMQKADWMTGLAGAGGVIGVGFGLWWADAAAAAMISLSILHDGFTALRIAAAELVDGAPRKLGSSEMAEDAAALKEALERRYPGARVRMRESGRYIIAQVCGARPEEHLDIMQIWPGNPEDCWRLSLLSFVPPGEMEARRGP